MPALYADSWLILGWLAALALLLQAVRSEQWRSIRQSHLSAWLGCCVVILLVWQLKAQVQAGIAFHILGTSALTLIAGRHRALLGIAAIISLQAIFGHIPWQNIGLLWLLQGAIPAYLTWQLLQWAQRKLALNYFVYIFFNCFAAAALSMWSYGIAHVIILALSGSYELDFLREEILPYYFLMGWPEAFTTGLNLTLLVVWQPQWVSSFDDGKYLQK